MKKICVYVTLLFMIVACKEKNKMVEDLKPHVYEVFHPIRNITYEKLVADGFEDMMVDVKQLGRDLNDSTFLFYLINDFGNNEVIEEVYTIEFRHRLSLDEINSFVRSHDGMLATPLCSDPQRIVFFVARIDSGFFNCAFLYKDSSSMLIINYRYPAYYNYLDK